MKSTDKVEPMGAYTVARMDAAPHLPPTEGSLATYTRPVLHGAKNFWKGITFDSPLLGAAYTGLGLAGLGYTLGPSAGKWTARILSPAFGRPLSAKDEATLEAREEATLQDKEKTQKEKYTWAAILGTAGVLSHLALVYRGPGSLKTYGIPKTNSLFNNSLSLDRCEDMIMANPGLTLATKMQAMDLLGSFNEPPTYQVTGGDLVGQAIATGQSAAVGAGIGYITAVALGLPNPKSTAILGAVANTLGVGPALATSLIFGS